MQKERRRPSSRSTKRMAASSNCQLQCFGEPSVMSLNPKRTIAELKELRDLTGDANGAQRVAFTQTWARARAWLRRKLEEFCPEIHTDEAGNLWATLRGDSEQALLI